MYACMYASFSTCTYVHVWLLNISNLHTYVHIAFFLKFWFHCQELMSVCMCLCMSYVGMYECICTYVTSVADQQPFAFCISCVWLQRIVMHLPCSFLQLPMQQGLRKLFYKFQYRCKQTFFHQMCNLKLIDCEFEKTCFLWIAGMYIHTCIALHIDCSLFRQNSDKPNHSQPQAMPGPLGDSVDGYPGLKELLGKQLWVLSCNFAMPA